MLHDHFNRRISYLRLSITDRCNLRCRYCVPDGKFNPISHNKILSYEDLLRISQAAVKIGVEKIRITGGEPLVRKGVVDFIASLNRIEGLRELVLTTNGVLLDKFAQDLKEAGLKRVNVSLDSLDSEVFKSITRVGSLADVLNGIHAAEEVGLPLKINMVVMRGINDNEIEDFVRLTLTKNISIRFIEYMPIGNDPSWKKLIVPSTSLLKRLTKRFNFSPVLRNPRSGPAMNYRVEGAAGTFGVISPVSGLLCQSCNRVRVTSVGKAKGCLFACDEIDLRPGLASSSDDLLEQIIKVLVVSKQEHHGMNFNTDQATTFQMSSIGG